MTSHGAKQVERLLSSLGIEFWPVYAYWIPYIVRIRVHLVWVSFATDSQEITVLLILTGHGWATPVLWSAVSSSPLTGNHRPYEYEPLCRFAEDFPAGVKVTVGVDPVSGVPSCFYALNQEPAFEYLISLRDDVM